MELSTDGAEPPPEPGDETVEVGFGHLTGNGPRRRAMPIEAPHWTDSRANYAGDAAGAFDTLMAMSGDAPTGKMLLLHGPPGTGKTSALRDAGPLVAGLVPGGLRAGPRAAVQPTSAI